MDYTTLTDYELGWIVGMIEGEGCFSMSRHYRKDGSCLCYLKFQIGSTDLDIISSFHHLVEAATKIQVIKRKAKAHNTIYKFQLFNAPAIELAMATKDLLGVRRKARIEELLVELDTQIRAG